jgi:hypothetical protein
MAKPFGNPIAQCPKCRADIGDAHPYSWCAECGEQLPQEIAAKLPAAQIRTVSPSRKNRGLCLHDTPERGYGPLCITLGVVFLLIGGWFLLNPASEMGESLQSSGLPLFINIHRLYIGQTSAIVGAIFLAVGIRPRT